MKSDIVVHDAIDRWIEAGLIGEELAGRLRSELGDSAVHRSRLTAQYFIAGTAGLVLLIAAGLFVARSWTDIPMLFRTALLGFVGGGVMALGVVLENRPNVKPVSYLLQTSGLILLLITYLHADNNWSRGSAGAIVVGLCSLATPFAATWFSLQRNRVMPAVNAAIGYAFIAVFLDRLGVNPDVIVWILDGVLLVVLAALVPLLRSEREDTPTILYAFSSSMIAGFFLVGMTSLGPLDARNTTVFALDAWMGILVSVLLWAIHRAPHWLKQHWYDDLLALCTVVGSFLVFASLDEIGVSSDFTGLGSGAIGALGLYYGVRYGMGSMIGAGCIAIIVSVWHFGINQAGSLGAVGALGITAALLFWVSSRLGNKDPVDRGVSASR